MLVPGDEVDDEFEARLNAALGAYSDSAESLSPAVLAARVLAAGRESKKLSRPWMYWGVAAASVSALCAVLAFDSWSRLTPLPRAPQISRASISVPSYPSRGQVIEAAAPPRPRAPTHLVVSSGRRMPPKLDQFPQPRPLSAQEKLMLAIVASASAADQRIVAQAAAPPIFMRIAETQMPTESEPTPHRQN